MTPDNLSFFIKGFLRTVTDPSKRSETEKAMRATAEWQRGMDALLCERQPNAHPSILAQQIRGFAKQEGEAK